MVSCCAAKEAIFCPLMFQRLFGTITTSLYKNNKSSLIYHRRSAKKYGKKVMLIKSTKSPANSFKWFLFLFYDRRHFFQTITKVSVGISLCCLLDDLFRNMLEKKASEIDYYLNAILLDCSHCLFCHTILVFICVKSQIREPRIESREKKRYRWS